MKRVLNEQIIEAYGAYLLREEKSGATVEKYLRDLRGLACRCRGGRLQRKNPDHSCSGQAAKAAVGLCKKHRLGAGPIFLGKTGKPLDRSSIWRMMKKLCAATGGKRTKVFPHNLRKLFARTFYGIDKDIAKLADVLGHSSINTTRIYIMSTGVEHRRQLDRLGLVV